MLVIYKLLFFIQINWIFVALCVQVFWTQDEKKVSTSLKTESKQKDHIPIIPQCK